MKPTTSMMVSKSPKLSVLISLDPTKASRTSVRNWRKKDRSTLLTIYENISLSSEWKMICRQNWFVSSLQMYTDLSKTYTNIFSCSCPLQPISLISRKVFDKLKRRKFALLRDKLPAATFSLLTKTSSTNFLTNTEVSTRILSTSSSKFLTHKLLPRFWALIWVVKKRRKLFKIAITFLS